MKRLGIMFREYLSDDSGSTAIEYALIAALIGVGLIAGLKAFGDSNNGAWGNMTDDVDDGLNS